ncbi:hypothetical protein FPV67DRAFT_1453324 [Lyophyllum atratum]|nr:hypothetical protein FPV67DRAFT_1453324 [Lyophyllum atratum]
MTLLRACSTLLTLALSFWGGMAKSYMGEMSAEERRAGTRQTQSKSSEAVCAILHRSISGAWPIKKDTVDSRKRQSMVGVARLPVALGPLSGYSECPISKRYAVSEIGDNRMELDVQSLEDVRA